MSISANIDAIKKQLQDEHGVEYSYCQVIDYLINFYRRQQAPKTVWQK